MKRVAIEAPFAGGTIRRYFNRRYAKRCVHHSLMMGEAPFHSPFMYAMRGVLDDTVPAERKMGIEAGLAWLEGANAVAVYLDRGISPGMKLGIAAAKAAGVHVEYRTLNPSPTTTCPRT